MARTKKYNGGPKHGPGEAQAAVKRMWRKGKGKSVREIADALDISTQAVYGHIHALQKKDR